MTYKVRENVTSIRKSRDPIMHYIIHMLSHNIRSNQSSLTYLQENMPHSPANQSHQHWTNGMGSIKTNNGFILSGSSIFTPVKHDFQNTKTNISGHAWVNGKLLQIITMFHVNNLDTLKPKSTQEWEMKSKLFETKTLNARKYLPGMRESQGGWSGQ